MASKKSPKKRLKRAIPYIFILGVVLILLTTGFLLGRLTVESDSSKDVSDTSSTIFVEKTSIVEPIHYNFSKILFRFHLCRLK